MISIGKEISLRRASLNANTQDWRFVFGRPCWYIAARYVTFLSCKNAQDHYPWTNDPFANSYLRSSNGPEQSLSRLPQTSGIL